MSKDIKRTLREAKLTVTEPRITVVKRLTDVGKPLEMPELISLCSDIDRATVYRTVATLEKHGIVKKVQIGWKYKIELGDDMHDHHHHMSCIACGKIIDFHESDLMIEEFRKLEAMHGFRASTHNLELTGLCQSCQK